MWLTSKLSALHSSLFDLLQLRYPMNRPYEQKSLTYAAYGFMLLVVCILIPVNCGHESAVSLDMFTLTTRSWKIDALQGYETVTTYEQDPNTTSVHWYHAFTGKPTPGSQCDDHIFSLGDTFQTSISTLSYTLQSIKYNSSDGMNNWGGTTIPYKGLSTDFCDIIFLDLGLTPAMASMVDSAMIRCIHEDFQVNASTSIDFIELTVADPGPLLYLNLALVDLMGQAFPTPPQLNSSESGALLETMGDGTITATQSPPWFCPMFLAKNETDIDGGALELWNTTFLPFCTPQQYDQPTLNVNYLGILVSGNSSNFNVSFQNAVENYMEVFASVIRYDLGSRLPGNFLVNPSAVLSQNQTFLPVGPPSDLTTVIQEAISGNYGYLPLAQPYNASAPDQPAAPTLAVTYVCHLTVPKSAASAAVSVIVATITIGAAIWKLLMLAVAYFAKGNMPGANHGEHYTLEEGLPKSLNTSEEHVELLERSDLQQTRRATI